MTHIAGHDRSQTLLLPESLDDYVSPENPVRFIEAFVDGLDLTTAGFMRVSAKRTGRPGYAPADTLLQGSGGWRPECDRGSGAALFLTRDAGLALQAEPGPPPPHPRAETQGHELAG